MKQNKFLKFLRSAFGSYIIFFLLFGFVISCSFLLFFSSIELTREQIEISAKATFINVLILTSLITAIDLIRRKITVDIPVNKINTALKKITNGDFSVRLNTRSVNESFSEIMESINTMTEELSGVETLRTDFISNVSHEMKTPLSVMGNYGVLMQNPDLPEEQRIEYAKNITQSSKRLADLITNILKLNKLENQQIYPQAQPYNLGEQLCECVLSFESTWESKCIELETEIEEDVIITADSELLSIVWNNLLSNAFKFTENGGKVGISLKAEENSAIVTVRDTGCGMNTETGRHIFEKFYQGDSSHATQGNGLGLALVKRIIDITGGEVSVSSALGEGSTFTVKIPLKSTDEF